LLAEFETLFQFHVLVSVCETMKLISYEANKQVALFDLNEH